MFPLIPSVIYQLVNDPEFYKTDLSSVVTIGSGAAYLPPKLYEKFRTAIPNSAAMAQGQTY
jgi:acyl-CoA synthetase (AMP-forming)/AMP-acid ligase II